MSNNKSLLQPFTLGSLTLANRIVLAPLTRGRAGKSRVPNDLMTEYYAQRGSAGLIVTEATNISEQAIGWEGAPGIYNKEQTEGWRKLLEGVNEKTNGKAILFLQLWHTGRASHSSFRADNSLPVAPSPIALSGEVHTPTGKAQAEVPHALSFDEIQQVVADFKKAAENAKEAGFPGVEIHSANGYLLDQFLQSKTNHRDDQYGGSIENRFRLLKQVVEAILEVYPSNRVGIRLAPNGVYNDMGSPDYLESFTYYFQQLNNYNLAFLHILDGLAFGFHQLGEPVTLNYIRKYFNGPLIGNCGYEFATAEKAIESGDGDLIAFGRAYISNPDLVERYANDWPLNPSAPSAGWYGGASEGYTDFPFYQETKL